jgi:aminopeptidase N
MHRSRLSAPAANLLVLFGLALAGTWGCGSDEDGSGASMGGSAGIGGTAGDGGTAGGSGGGSATGGNGGGIAPAPGEDWTRDIVSTALELDVSSLKGKATITLAATDSEAASFEVGDLTITSVAADGTALNYERAGAQLDIGVPSTGSASELVIEYELQPHNQFDGYSPVSQSSFTWPGHCGNFFPCKSTPAEGSSYTMKVAGVPAGEMAIYPQIISADAPSYMPAVAVGQYTQLELGTTAAGTSVNVWHLPNQELEAKQGSAHLLGAFEFMESTYGDYTFGKEVGQVAVSWPLGALGGVEHHPYWHVASGALPDEQNTVHEAAHGWFGNGVRIASEGLADYLAARVLSSQGVDIWTAYECRLKTACGFQNTVALPDATCNEIDLATSPLFGLAPYQKGAWFLRDVAMLIGESTLDGALSEFYVANVSKAARMQGLIDYIKTKADSAQAAQIDASAQAWLRELSCPVDTSALCP